MPNQERLRTVKATSFHCHPIHLKRKVSRLLIADQYPNFLYALQR